MKIINHKLIVSHQVTYKFKLQFKNLNKIRKIKLNMIKENY